MILQTLLQGVQGEQPHTASFENKDSADYFVFVDDLVLTQTNDFAKGLNLWFISHYIFNLHYEKQVQEVALFFQEFIWNLQLLLKKKNRKMLHTSW